MYLFIHNRLDEKFNNKEVPIKTVFEIFGKYYRIQKKFRYPILKELEDLKLVSKINKTEIVILSKIIGKHLEKEEKLMLQTSN